MRTINKQEEQEEEELKRVNFHIKAKLHRAFKAATAARGVNMTDVLVEYIQEYVQKHGAAPAKKGRRG